MPAKGSTKRGERLCRRRQVAFSDAELSRVKDKSKAAGRTQAKFMREAVLAAIGEGELPKPKRTAPKDQAVAELERVRWLLSNLSKNINQLARQANSGMVQIRRAEVEYLLNQHQTTLSQAAAVMERFLA